jgi:hypothetical protein
MSNFIKIRPVGAELFDADGRTDTTNLIVVFRTFANQDNSSPISILTCKPISEESDGKLSAVNTKLDVPERF